MIGHLELGGDPRLRLGHKHLDPLVVAVKPCSAASRSWTTVPFNDTSARSHASTSGMNGVINNGCVPARGGPVGGTEEASWVKYLRTVRRSQQHSRPNLNERGARIVRVKNRRMFIQASESRIMSPSPSGRRLGG